MNHAYRLVWNVASASYTPAPETARRCGKRGSVKALVAAVSLLGGSTALGADLPTGGSIVSGSGSIISSGNTLTVTQNSSKLIANWQGFDIGAGNTVNFVQPGSSAVALNRVLGNEASQIYGSLNANGQVFLINPNGVLFGQGASVNVGGLVASTLSISDSDFLAGNHVFTGKGKNSTNASVINQGTIKADGGVVALLGGTVSNQGVIQANLGSVALAAGNKVTLDFAGDGLLNVTVDESALNALVENHQLIRADGGSVLLTAKATDALLQTVVNNTGVIEARTLQEHEGKIILLGGFEGGTVKVAGTLDASAPLSPLSPSPSPAGGEGSNSTAGTNANASTPSPLAGEGDSATANGGFIETSGAHVQIADSATVTTKAANGQNGKWLIDPTDFTVAASGGDMTGAALTNALANGDVQIQSTAGASGTGGDVNIKDTVSWNQNTLTLDAQRDINVYSAMNASGTAGLFFKYGQADAGGSYNIYAPVNLASTSSFRTQSGSAGDITNWTIITSLGSETDVTGNAGTILQGIWGNLGGNFVLGADIDASSTAGWNGGLGFTPLGGNNPGAINNPAFSGNFDGLGHVIDGLTINRPDINQIGLFGDARGASFANLGLSNVSISGNTQVGGLVGRSGNVIIYNSYVTGTVTGQDAVGGVIGSDIFPRGSSSLINVYSSADVTATRPGTGNGTLSGIAGGLVGSNVNLVENSYSTGNVTGGNYVGGLVGYANEATVKNSYFAGTITVNGAPYTSGVILGGRLTDIGNVLTNVYWNTDLTGTSLTASGNSNATLTNASGLTTTQMRNAANWAGFNFVTTPGQNGWLFADGAMPLLASEWSSTIRNVHQLQLMALDLSASYVLANDIDASATNGAAGDVWYGGSFSPIGTAAGKFTGSLDGQGHVIDGLTIDRGAQDNVGLFGYAGDGAFFANVGLRNAGITGRAFVGTLLGQGGNTDAVSIDNAWSSGTVTSTSTSQTQGAIGGLVGGMSGTIDNSHSSATVTGNNRVGGLVGQMSVDSNANKIQQISNSYATGDVSATFGYGGGLVGRNFARIANSYATGDVSGGTVLGGLVGYGSIATYWNNQQDPNTKDSYLNVYASGNVTGTGNDVGGLFGLTQGLVGVHNAFATGNVVGAKNVGGLIGRVSDGGSSSQQASLWSVFTQGGTVTGQDNVGGLIGSSGWVHVTNSYSASGLLTATDSNAKLGGLIGGNNTALSANIFIFDNGVWNIETTGTDFAVGDNAWGSFFITAPSGTQYLASGHTVGATTAQMMTVEPYAVSGFNNGQGGLVGYSIVTAANAAGNDYFQLLYSNNIYFLYEGQTYPLLRAFLQKVTVNADLSGANKTYDGQIASGTVGSYTTSIPVDASLILGSLSYATNSANAGTYTTSSGLNVSGGLYSGQLGYEITYSPTTSLTIGKASAIVTANSGTFTYNGQSQSVTGFTATGLVNDETESVLTGLTENGGSGTNAGSYAHTVSGSDNNYNLTFVDGVLTIGKADATVTANSATTTYNGQSQSVSGFTATGLVNGETESVLAGLSESGGSGTNAGSYVHTVSGTDGNYNLTFVDGALTIDKAALTVSTGNVSKIYDGTISASGFAIVTGGQLFGSDSLSGGDFAFDDKNAGSNKTVTVSGVTVNDGNGGGNYAVSYVANTTSTIDKAALTVSTSDVVKTYDGDNTAAGAAVVVGGQLFGPDQLSGGHFTFDNPNAGTNKTVFVSGVTVDDGNGGGNYQVAFADNTSSTITPKALTVSGITAADKVYDGNQTATVDVSGADLDGLVAGDDLGLTATGEFSDKNAGAGKTVALTSSYNGADAGNYTITNQDATTADIIKASATVTANSATTTYNGQSQSVAGFTATGLVNGETESVLMGLTENGGSGTNAGSYAHTVSGSDGNYNLTFVDGALTIDKAALTISTGNVSKTYDGTTVAAGNAIHVGGTLYGSDSLSGGDFAFDDKNAGSNKTVTVSSVTVNDGNGGGNYDVTYVANTSSTIDKAALTLNAATDSKTYDGSTASGASVGYSGLVAGDTLSGLTQSFASKDVLGMNGSTLQVEAGYVLNDGNNGGNYIVTMNTATGTITPKALSISGTTANGKTYDGSTTASITAGTLDGLVGSETLNVSATGEFDSANAGTRNATASYTLADGSGLASNYTLADTTGHSATIARAGITVSSTDVTKTYDGTTTANAATRLTSGTLFGDDTLAGGTFAFADKNAGVNKIVTVSGVTVDDGNSGGNYDITYADNTTSTIHKATLTITANDDGKPYDGLAYHGGNGVAYAGFVNGETDSELGGALVYGGNSQGALALGNYDISISGLSSGNYDISYADGVLAITAPQAAVTPGLLPAYEGAHNAQHEAPLLSLPLAESFVLEVNGDGIRLLAVPVDVQVSPSATPVATVPTAAPVETHVTQAPLQELLPAPGTVLFASNSPLLDEEEARRLLKALADRLKANPQEKVRLVGHTDNTGSENYNSTLSQKRAEEVSRVLQSLGVASSQIEVTGESFRHPLDSNDSEQGRARNRRVDFVAP